MAYLPRQSIQAFIPFRTRTSFNSLVGVVSTDQEILSKTQAQGVFNGSDVTYTSVIGATVEAIVLYRKNAGANTTWPLIAYLDTGANLPATPNNGNVTIAWAESGIFGI